MGILELFLIGVSLSMDAFAVAVCQGLCMPKLNLRHGTVIALFFGGFQALMPFLGWVLGSQFARYIENVDHWVAFGLLALIGGNMVREAMSPEEEEETACAVADRLDFKRLFMMAVATSIDALAVGISLAILRANIWVCSSWIGIITFTLSALGVRLGKKLGDKFQRSAGLLGGLVLICIGIKILVEHLTGA